MGRKKGAQKAAKQDKYQVAFPEENKSLYERLEAVVARGHKTQLGDARIVIAWVADVKPDKDGLVKFWWVELVSKVQKQLMPFDVILKINQSVWQGLPQHHNAILDEALCAIVPITDKDGAHKRDTRDRPLYFQRKPRIQVFPENCKRHGLWQTDAEEFVREMVKQGKLGPTTQDIPGLEDQRPKPEPRETRLSPEATNRIVGAIAATSDGTKDAYVGWKLARPAKVGKALTREVARADIDRVNQLLESGNRSAAIMLRRKLEDAGWDAPATFPDERTSSEAKTYDGPTLSQEVRGALGGLGFVFVGPSNPRATEQLTLDAILAIRNPGTSEAARDVREQGTKILRSFGWERRSTPAAPDRRTASAEPEARAPEAPVAAPAPEPATAAAAS